MKIMSEQAFEVLPGLYDADNRLADLERKQWNIEACNISQEFDQIRDQLLKSHSFEERSDMISKAKLLRMNGMYFPVFKLPAKFAVQFGSRFWISSKGFSKAEFACVWAITLPHYLTPEFC